MEENLALVGVALVGCVIGSCIALVPGLHVYSVAALAFVLGAQKVIPLDNEPLALLLIGLVVGWSVVNVVPSVFLFAPDDASAFVVLPSTKMLARGRGAEATVLVGAGSVCALVALVVVSPILDEVLRPLRAIVSPNLAWMLVAIVAFMLLSEWPRANDRAPTPARRLASAWAYLGAGLLTFALSGVLGLVLMFRSPIAVGAAFQNLLPAFVGLFAVPGLIQTLAFGRNIPKQNTQLTLAADSWTLARGALTGLAGGLFAGFLPIVTGGVGSLLAGHATAQRDERVFLVSQGAAKIAYYVGALLLLFVPGVSAARGGAAGMLTTVYVPYGWRVYALAVAAVALCGALAFVLLLIFTRASAALSSRVSPKIAAGVALVVALTITAFFTGVAGLAIAVVATFIGLIPIFVGGRRMNCLGVLLVPLTLSVVGVGSDVARWLGL